jgi:type II secretory pathway component PulF
MDFRYSARTAAGARISGSLSATDRESAVAGLRSHALFVTSVEPKRLWHRDLHLPRPARERDARA